MSRVPSRGMCITIGNPSRSAEKLILTKPMSEQAYVFDAALEQIAELARSSPGFRDGLPRRALMGLFEVLGSDVPRVKRYRQTLFGH